MRYSRVTAVWTAVGCKASSALEILLQSSIRIQEEIRDLNLLTTPPRDANGLFRVYADFEGPQALV